MLRDTKKIILGAIVAAGIIFPLVVSAARTNDLWLFPSGATYLQTNAQPGGIDILINGSNRYLNFNTVTGTNGYGFRDNAGTMEFKNSGGAWTGIGAGGGGSCSSNCGLATTSPWTVNQLAQVVDNGHVTSIATSSLGLLTTNVAEGTNLYYTLTRWATALAGTTTDALAQGSVNKYWSQTLFDNALSATTSVKSITTLPSLSLPYSQVTGTPDLSIYFTLAGWYATTSAPQLTALANLATVGTISTGIWHGTAIGTQYGGTGQNFSASTGLVALNSGVASAISTTSMNASITGNSGTATALAANGTNCSAGSFALGVDASGNAEGCTVATTGTVTAVNGTANQITSSGGATPTLSLPNLVLFPSAASSTQFSVFGKAYFGGSATTTIDSGGNIVIPSGASLTNTGVSNGCGTFASGVLGSTGSPCGTSGGITALGNYATTTGTAISLSTTTVTTNGQTLGLTIGVAANGIVFTPTISGTLNNAGLTNSSITVNGTAFNLGDSKTITAASSTILSDNNTFSGNNIFSLPLSLTAVTGTTTIAAGQGFTVGGSQLVVQQGSGNVGVGTTTPAKIFTVYGNQSGGIARIERSPGATVAATKYGTYDIALQDGTGVNGSGPAQTFSYINTAGTVSTVGDIWGFRNGADNTGNLVLSSYKTGSIENTLTIDGSNGDIGIGTTSPSNSASQCGNFTICNDNEGVGFNNEAQMKQIASSSAAQVRVFWNARDVDGTAANERGEFGTETNNNMGFFTNNTARMELTKAGGLDIGPTFYNGATIPGTSGGLLVEGTVGIGTSTPTGKFAIQLNNGDTNTTAFTIASSTSGATTTLFNVSNTGTLTTTLGTGCVLSTSGVLSVSGSGCNAGTVTSIGMTVPTFLSVSPASITTNGTFAVTLSGTALPVLNGGTGLTTTGASSTVLTTNGTTNAWQLLSLTSGVYGTLPVANGGTNAGAFTLGSVVFAGSGGTYTQDNANFFWDATNHRLGIGTTTPEKLLQVEGNISGGVARIQRDFAAASGNIVGTYDVDLSETSGIADLAGPTQTFSIRNNGGTVNTIGDIGAFRNGADNTGSMQIRAYNSGGVVNSTLVLDGVNGILAFGTSSPSSILCTNTLIFCQQNTATAANVLIASTTATGMVRSIFDANAFVSSGNPNLSRGEAGTVSNHPFALLANNTVWATLAKTGQFGIGTTTPFALLSLSANSGQTNTSLFLIASSTATATTTAFDITNTGHIIASSTNPVLSSCGTSPTMKGSDVWGEITVGATATGCTVTFAQAWSAAPVCTISNQSMSITSALSYTISASALTISQAVGLGGDKIDFYCMGISGFQ